MKKFDSREKLIEYISAEYSQEAWGINQEIDNFLACEGSDIVNNKFKEPDHVFTVDFNNCKYEIGITSMLISEDEYNYYYWIGEE